MEARERALLLWLALPGCGPARPPEPRPSQRPQPRASTSATRLILVARTRPTPEGSQPAGISPNAVDRVLGCTPGWRPRPAKSLAKARTRGSQAAPTPAEPRGPSQKSPANEPASCQYGHGTHRLRAPARRIHSRQSVRRAVACGGPRVPRRQRAHVRRRPQRRHSSSTVRTAPVTHLAEGSSSCSSRPPRTRPPSGCRPMCRTDDRQGTGPWGSAAPRRPRR